MLENYWPIAVLLVISVGIAIIVIGLGHLIGPRSSNEIKDAPYESGMIPIGAGTRRMPIRFYIVAVLFILFDIEVIFLFPWAVIFRDFVDKGWGGFAILEIVLFFAILLVGYIYAWKKGALEWD
jgi:NADH-quinone oxidoreductase subunit A